MTRSAFTKLAFLAVPAVIAALVWAGCSSVEPAALAQGCVINSDCASPLICVYGLCHEACEDSRDCPLGAICIASGSNKVCELPTESSCKGGKPCPVGLVCASDEICRDSCSTAQPCTVTHQVCLGGACFDSTDAGADGGRDSGKDGAPVDGSKEADADAGKPPPDTSLEGATDSGPPPASCVAGGLGMTNCGADGGESCCASLPLPSGSYDQTYTYGEPGATNKATLQAFRLDKYLVTVGRFRQFVNAVLPPDGGAGYRPSPGSGIHSYLNGGSGLENSAELGSYETGWDATDWNSQIDPTDANLGPAGSPATWTVLAAGGQENLPINYVNWYEAYAFCIWDGGFLPSAAEGEYAAAGGSMQLEYPWGSTGPGDDNQYAIYGCYYPAGDGGVCDNSGATNIAPVGFATKGVGLWGQLDLSGEVYEWLLDYYGPASTCDNCALLTNEGQGRADRGGIYDDDKSYLLSASTGLNLPTTRSDEVGFRCARAP